MSGKERATLEVIAQTVEEAVGQGLADLGLPPEAVDVEILDAGSRGLLGLGGRQARVRLSIKAESMARVEAENVSEPIPGEDNSLDILKEVVDELLQKMGIGAKISVGQGDADDTGNRPFLVDLSGEDLGVLVGRRAEILNSLQYIVNLIMGKRTGHWVQVIVDVEGYRVRRERQLRQMARRMAEQTIKTGRRQVLEPMTSADRRIIHLELRDHPDVVTQSVGEEPTRKVTIVPR